MVNTMIFKNPLSTAFREKSVNFEKDCYIHLTAENILSFF